MAWQETILISKLTKLIIDGQKLPVNLASLEECKRIKERVEELIEKIPVPVSKQKKTRGMTGNPNDKMNEDQIWKILQEIKDLKVNHPKVEATEKHL